MSSGPDLSAPVPRPLSSLTLHENAQVDRVDPGAQCQQGGRPQQLTDIGFMPGEGASAVTRAWPGGDPLVVREVVESSLATAHSLLAWFVFVPQWLSLLVDAAGFFTYRVAQTPGAGT